MAIHHRRRPRHLAVAAAQTEVPAARGGTCPPPSVREANPPTVTAAGGEGRGAEIAARGDVADGERWHLRRSSDKELSGIGGVSEHEISGQQHVQVRIPQL